MTSALTTGIGIHKRIKILSNRNGKKSERIENTGIIFGTALVVNRLASAISSIFISNSSGNEVKVTSDIIRNRDNSVDGFMLHLQKNF